jgi:hypothetical protein
LRKAIRWGICRSWGFLAIVNGLPEYAQDFARFLYLSGLRVGAVRGLEHRHVDGQGGVIRLSADLSKNKRGQLIPIRGELLTLMGRAKANRNPECPYLFHRGTHGKRFQTAWVKAGLGQSVKERRASDGDKPDPHARKSINVFSCMISVVPPYATWSVLAFKGKSPWGWVATRHEPFSIDNILNEGDLGEAIEKLQGYLAEQSQTPKVKAS